MFDVSSIFDTILAAITQAFSAQIIEIISQLLGGALG